MDLAWGVCASFRLVKIAIIVRYAFFMRVGILFIIAVFTLGFLGCSPQSESNGSAISKRFDTNTKFFGYVGTDCGTNYISEVRGFTNIGQMCIYDAGDIRARLEAFNQAGMRAILDLHFLFFAEGGPVGGSGTGYNLRPDYLQRWAQFLSTNQSHLNMDYVAAIYPAEEPTWLGVSTQELQTIATLVNRDLPDLPLLLIEAHQALQDLIIPVEFDLVGMDFYGAIDPRNTAAFNQYAWLNSQFQNYFTAIKARRSRSDQKLVLVFDAQWSPVYESVGYSKESIANFVENYYLLMQSDPEVQGMFGYVYLSGLDGADWIGLRDLPQSVKDANIGVGRAITGK